MWNKNREISYCSCIHSIMHQILCFFTELTILSRICFYRGIYNCKLKILIPNIYARADIWCSRHTVDFTYLKRKENVSHKVQLFMSTKKVPEKSNTIRKFMTGIFRDSVWILTCIVGGNSTSK